MWKCRHRISGVSGVNCNDILYLFHVAMSFNRRFTWRYLLSISKEHSSWLYWSFNNGLWSL